MEGIGPPLVTPFDRDGNLDEERLVALVDWVVDRGVDFIVPCGSNSEAELMSIDERATVVELVVERAPENVPILAGTGHPGRRETRRQTELAAEAGADAALVVTPFYYGHDQGTLATYYREVADASSIPIYLYSVPKLTHVALDPDVVGDLAAHPNIVGMKDSSGDLAAFQRERRLAGDDFELFVGNGGVFAHALAAGADGAVLALANVAPERVGEAYDLHQAGSDEEALALGADIVELNRAVTARFGVPGVKAAMRARGAPAGYARAPHEPVADETVAELQSLLDAAGIE